MLGGFRKTSKRSNMRKKIMTTGSDEEESGVEKKDTTFTESATLKHVVSAPVLSKSKPKIHKSSSVLSFNDELNTEDEFVIRRSKASLNLEDQMKKEKKQKKKKPKTSEQKRNDENTNNYVNQNTVIKFPDEDEEDNDESTIQFSVTHRFNTSGDIPDAATIYAMKKKREQARQFGNQISYIPLNSNKYIGRFSSENSRLVRDEMDDSSDDERVEMKGTGASSHPALERRKQVAKALEEANDESNDEKDNDDEEFQRWENEQIKKGSQIPSQQPEQYGPKLPEKMGSILSSSTLQYSTTLPSGYAPQMYSSMYCMPVADSQVQNVEFVVTKLKEHLSTKKQLFCLHQRERDKIKFDLESSKENIVNLERKSVDFSDQFSFYQDIRGFVKDLCECFNEKLKAINNFENAMHQNLQKKSEKLVTQRQNDVKDEVDEIAGKPTTDTERINNIRNRRIAEREGRRSRRREKRQAINTIHYEGMSSDDELLSTDSLRFEAEEGKIMNEAKQVFEDVVSDFSSIGEIMSRFEQWKYGFNDSYKDTYLGLCLPKIFSPFIKLELLNWNPLEIDGCKDFEEMEWFQTLILYGDHEGKLERDDEDLNLLPIIIEKVLLPKLTALMRDVWDPLSAKQTKLAAFLFQRLVDDYPTITKESKQTKALVECIVVKLKTAVDSELYIPLYPHTMLENKNSHALSFLERQFWKGVKLLGNVMHWNWLLSQKKLQELGVDAIVNRYLIIALQQFPDSSACLEKAKMVVSCLPKEWLEKSDEGIPGFASFARYLASLAEKIYKSSLGYSDEQGKKRTNITIKKIISLLMNIQAFDEARLVATNCKDEKKKAFSTPHVL